MIVGREEKISVFKEKEQGVVVDANMPNPELTRLNQL